MISDSIFKCLKNIFVAGLKIIAFPYSSQTLITSILGSPALVKYFLACSLTIQTICYTVFSLFFLSKSVMETFYAGQLNVIFCYFLSDSDMLGFKTLFLKSSSTNFVFYYTIALPDVLVSITFSKLSLLISLNLPSCMLIFDEK